jgi:hypothetical protein
MENFSPLMWLGCGIAVLAVLISPKLRLLVGAAVFIFCLIAGKSVFIKEHRFPAGQAELFEPVMEQYAGWCWSGDNAAVVKQGGWYNIAAGPGVAADCSCFDWRFWQKTAAAPQ